MKQVKTAAFITAVISLMFLAACGGGGSSSDAPFLSIQTATVNAYVGETATIQVTARNTDFTVSVSPATGSGCAKSGNNVVCTTSAVGTYTVTVTAIADTTKSVSATVAVTNPAAQIAAGYAHTIGIKKDGSLWAWGGNYVGQLGDGTLTGQFTPVLVYNGMNQIQ